MSENRNGNILSGMTIPEMSKGMKKAILAALAIAIIAGFVISLMPVAPTKFIIKPMVVYEGKAIALGSAPLVMPEGASFVINLGKSSVPSPPVTYLYDNNGDGVPETPLTNGNWAEVIMYKSDPLPPVCKSVEGGELCAVKISGTDSAGNTAEFVFYSTTIYK